MIECKSATCNNKLVLNIHPITTFGYFFIGYYCDRCGWTKFVHGPYQTYNEAVPVLKNLKENNHA